MTAHTFTHADALASFPEARIDTAHRTIGYREAGATYLRTLPVVLLHGIGSGAASWVRQRNRLTRRGACSHGMRRGTAHRRRFHQRRRLHRIMRRRSRTGSMRSTSNGACWSGIRSARSSPGCSRHSMRRASRACCLCRRRVATARHRLKSAKRSATRVSRCSPSSVRAGSPRPAARTCSRCTQATQHANGCAGTWRASSRKATRRRRTCSRTRTSPPT